MIKFEHTEVVGWEAAIRGMRNPMNSWEKSDSYWGCLYDHCDDCCHLNYGEGCSAEYKEYYIGPNDLDLMKRLVKAGTDHRKFMRMITVYVDITAPLYWWKEFDTYKIGTVANSCSTMHKIADKEFTLEDFSTEQLIVENDVNHIDMVAWLQKQIDILNEWRRTYLDVKGSPISRDSAKKYWWQMIQLLPSSYNQKRTVMMNYEVLSNIYKSRKNHKLDEWAEHDPMVIGMDTDEGSWSFMSFCDWIKTLPYSELITGEVEIENENTDNQIDIKQICTPNEIRRIFGLEPIEKEES